MTCPATDPENRPCALSADHPDPMHQAKLLADGRVIYVPWPNEDYVNPADERQRIRGERQQAAQTIREAVRSVRLDPKTHARRDDPSTSHEAAQPTRRKDAQYVRLLAAYREGYPNNFTSEEAGLRAGDIDLWRRASDLRKDGLIEYVPDPNSRSGYVERPLRKGRPGRAYRAVMP